MFSKDFLYSVIKSSNCMVKSETTLDEIYFSDTVAEIIEQDQTTSMCGLVLLYSLHRIHGYEQQNEG